MGRFDYSFDAMGRHLYEQQDGGTATATATATPTATVPPAQVATPAFNPDGGDYAITQPRNVTITTATAGANMRYTLNGTTPSESNGVLIASSTGTVSVTPTTDGTTLQAIAFEGGMTDSDVYSATYYYIGGNAPQQAGVASSQSAISPGYDGNGNLVAYKGWTYTYDAQNRLTSASNGAHTALFHYDGKNRQIMRSIDGGVRFSVWDDWELLEEYDADNARTAAYLQGAHGVIKSLLNNIYYYQDKLGSTTHIADANGTLESYHYDLYGTPAETSTHNIVDLYAGERWLPELGLYDLRNRFMSPELGRFLQADPVGFKGDASNLYRYCHNDSVDFSDPTGLVDEWKKQMLWQGGGDGSVSEQLKRLDEAAGIQSPPTNGHVRIEEARIVDATVDRTRYDSQRANVADDEHFADRGGAIADGQPPGLTSGHSFASDNATVRPVVFTQYGRYFDAGGGVLKPYGKQWSDVAKAGEPEHQREIAADMSRANLQARADKAFARGGVPELRKEMNKAMSNAVQKSGWAHDNPINGNHHLYKPQQMRWPYTKEALPYDQ